MKKICSLCGLEKSSASFSKGELVCKLCVKNAPNINPELLRYWVRIRNLSVNLFKPFDYQKQFLEEVLHGNKKIILLSGGNRVGKTLAAAIAIAKYALDNGNKRIIVCAPSLANLAQNIHDKFFAPGQFVLENGFASEPIIPEDFRVPGVNGGIGYTDKANKQWSICRLLNGTEIHAISYGSDIQERFQGFKADLIWCDEGWPKDGLLGELMARVSEPGAKLILSATYTDIAGELVNLREQVQESRRNDSVFFKWSYLDRPDITEEEKQAYINTIPEDERPARVYGELMARHGSVFKEYLHCLLGLEDMHRMSLIEKGHYLPSFMIPAVGCDPGSTKSGWAWILGIFDIRKGAWYIIDEFKEAQQSPKTAVRALHAMLEEWRIPKYEGLYKIVYDYAAGATPMGNIRAAVSEELVSRGISSVITGFSMLNARKADKRTSIAKLRDAFAGGSLFIVKDKCPKLLRELARYHYNKDGDIANSPDDLIDALRYMVTTPPTPALQENCVRKTYFMKIEEIAEERDRPKFIDLL